MFLDICELLVLGPIARTLQYWPLVKLLISLALICETTDYSHPAKIDEREQTRLKAEIRHARKLLEAENASQDSIDKIRREKTKEMEMEVLKTKHRKKRYNCFMLVEPFLPSHAAAGGPMIDYSTPPKARKRDKSTQQLVYSLVELDDQKRERELKMKEYYAEQLKKGDGLGNWKNPVSVIIGKVVDHNPLTDDLGNPLPQFLHGDASETPITTPWRHDQDSDIDISTSVILGDTPLNGIRPDRAENEKRIGFRKTTEWTNFEKDGRELSTSEFPTNIGTAHRYHGVFQGYEKHKPTEVSQLDSSRSNLHQSATRKFMNQELS